MTTTSRSTKTARLMQLGAMLTLMAGISGCAFFRGPSVATPAGFEARPEAALLLDPDTRTEGYRRLFPDMKNFQANGKLSGRGLPGGEIYVYLFAETPGGKPTDAARSMTMRGFNRNVDLFDVLVHNGRMTVVMYTSKQVFQGPIPRNGSPFAEIFGIEPWDLSSLFTLGQRLTTGDAGFRESWRSRNILIPVGRDRGFGLQRVRLDPESGLPGEASWRSKGRNIEIRYLGWQYFKDEVNDNQTRLMPSAMRIRRAWSPSGARVEARDYYYNRPVPEELFLLSRQAEKYPRFPLERLSKVLGE